jgi:hypothetical protein
MSSLLLHEDCRFIFSILFVLFTLTDVLVFQLFYISLWQLCDIAHPT